MKLMKQRTFVATVMTLVIAILALTLGFSSVQAAGAPNTPSDGGVVLTDSDNDAEKKPKATTKVKTTKSVKVLAGGTKEDIKKAIKDALVEAAKTEKDPFLKAFMEGLAQNDAALGSFADMFLQALKDGQAALTLSLPGVKMSGTTVCIGVINIEVFSSAAIGAGQKAFNKLKVHEAGHSTIGNEIAKQLGPKFAKKFKNDEDAQNKITSALGAATQKASDKYDEATGHGQKGDQKKEAKKAIEAVVKEEDC